MVEVASGAKAANKKLASLPGIRAQATAGQMQLTVSELSIED
jgi:hypothetical protein